MRDKKVQNTDRFGRRITYLRVSVTERCNLRCRYCMPDGWNGSSKNAELLSDQELIQTIQTAASFGIQKIRITGGEPLLRENIVSICDRISDLNGIEELCMTTNGILLPKYAAALREAGVSRLNLSLDTLDPSKYHDMTGVGNLEDFWNGFDAAMNAGYERIKINTVLIGGFNDMEIRDIAELTRSYPIDVRFIEMMPMTTQDSFPEDAFLSDSHILEQLPQLQKLSADEGVARMYQLPKAQGNIGLIRPISAHFCGSCNRLRLTADGKLKPCLHTGDEFSVKGLSEQERYSVFETTILSKPEWHGPLNMASVSRAGRSMSQIGG